MRSSSLVVVRFVVFGGASVPASQLVRSLAPLLMAEPFPFYRLANASTSGNCLTSATNFASSAEVLSFRHTSANGNGNFKSITGTSATLSGHRQRVAPLTNATPIRHDTRLR